MTSVTCNQCAGHVTGVSKTGRSRELLGAILDGKGVTLKQKGGGYKKRGLSKWGWGSKKGRHVAESSSKTLSNSTTKLSTSHKGSKESLGKSLVISAIRSRQIARNPMKAPRHVRVAGKHAAPRKAFF